MTILESMDDNWVPLVVETFGMFIEMQFIKWPSIAADVCTSIAVATPAPTASHDVFVSKQRRARRQLERTLILKMAPDLIIHT